MLALIFVLSVIGLVALALICAVVLKSIEMKNGSLRKDNKSLRSTLVKVREAAYEQSEYESLLSSKIRKIINEMEAAE